MQLVPKLAGASPIGFGAYRLEAGNAQHRAALDRALDLGCTLIDTASNYGDGQSERLIGEVLASRGCQDEVRVITKVGYVSPAMREEFEQAGIDTGCLPAISEESLYSLSDATIKAQLAVSRRRLGVDRLDIVLLHNPEHGVGEVTAATLSAFLDLLRRGSETLESEVRAGRLGQFGISSNVLATLDATLLDPILECMAEIAAVSQFRIVQFPFNPLEREAAVPTVQGSLIDRLAAIGLIGIGHRPLSSPRNGGVRFATYDTMPADRSALFETCVACVERSLQEQDIPHRAEEFMVIQFLRDNRDGVDQPELLDAIFAMHVYPFAEQFWPEGGDGFAAFAALHRALRAALLEKMNARNADVLAELAAAGVLDSADRRPLQQLACEYGLRSGLGHVLVGMRDPAYVTSLLPLLGQSDDRTSFPLLGH